MDMGILYLLILYLAMAYLIFILNLYRNDTA